MNQQLSRDSEPIAALSSGRDPAAIAVIRMTGSGSALLAETCLRPVGKAPWQHGEMRLCRFRDPETSEIIDEPMAVFFKGPASFTGQDSLEIFLHGGPWIVQKVLGILYKNGFRPAEPGEFTRRAYLNGKLDLTEAEGIRTLVGASSEQEWLAARQLASGRLKREIEALRKLIMEAMAWLEARIDFPDEKETSEVEWQEVDERVRKAGVAVDELLDSFDGGRIATQGLRVTLFGKPNAGKSTLLNHFLDHERAIVSEIPGTTRDYIEEACLLSGRLIRLTDTAGIRDEAGQVEQAGIERSVELAKDADVVIFLLPADADEKDFRQMQAWIKQLNPPGMLRVMTKSDLSPPSWAGQEEHSWLPVSCKNEQGTRELKKALVERVDSSLSGVRSEKTFITTARHKQSLETAKNFLDRFFAGRKQGAFEEMLAFELLEVARSLGGIIGEVDSDDILGVIFSSFCVGK